MKYIDKYLVFLNLFIFYIYSVVFGSIFFFNPPFTTETFKAKVLPSIEVALSFINISGMLLQAGKLKVPSS